MGIDVFSDGGEFLRQKGFNVIQANAVKFELGRTFDAVFAGEII
jgi:hypothetical protein